MNQESSSSALDESLTNNNNKMPFCVFFANNRCYRSDSCPYSHDRNAKSDMRCIYYLSGNCSYGKTCRFDHIKPKKTLNHSSNSSTLSQNQQSKLNRVPNAEINNFNLQPAPPVVNAWTVPLITNLSLNEAATSNYKQNYAVLPSENSINLADIPLCSFFEDGFCMHGNMCELLHGNLCEMCNKNVLHPFNKQLRVEHHRECLREHEKAMEKAFAEARSVDKSCGICMEKIFEKQMRFGILENCKHCYCLICIRKWRQNVTEFSSKTVRACPMCRIVSDYVIPSKVWVEEEQEKKRLIETYRENAKQIPCKYIKLGRIDDCPFGNKCFYKHQKLDGTIVDGESPRELQKRRRLFAEINGEFLNNNIDEENSIMTDVIHLIVDSAYVRAEASTNNARGRSTSE